MADVDLVRFAVVVDGGTIPFGRPFDSWAKLRMELLRANVLSPAYLSQAEEKFYRGESWRSPDTVPMTDEQLKELKLKKNRLLPHLGTLRNSFTASTSLV